MTTEKLMTCALCPNICRFACPMEEVVGTESASPQGKSRVALLLLQNRIPWSRDNVEILYQCLNCGACKEFCPFEEIDLGPLLREARKEAVGRGVVLPEVASRISSLKEYGNPYGEGGESAGVATGDAELFYFPGCTIEFREKGVARATLEVLERAGIKTRILRGLCCGLPALQIGDWEGFLKLSGEIKRVLEVSDSKTILVSCPGCFETLSKLYPEMGITLGAKVVHTSTFFLDLIENKRIKVKTISKKATYHDPCSLGRRMEIFEEPRKLLSSLGLEVLEPEKNREHAVCCGGGLTVLEEALEVTTKRKEELLATGAELFVTACPTCKLMFEMKKLEVKDLSEVLVEGLQVVRA